MLILFYLWSFDYCFSELPSQSIGNI